MFQPTNQPQEDLYTEFHGFFFMHVYKQSGQYQDVFDTHDIDHKTACTSLPEDEHLVVRNMSKTI